MGPVTAGWKSPTRKPLLIALASFAVIWILTPTIFWPMINELWGIHRGRISATDVEAVELVRRWFGLDSLRIGLIVIGFVASVQALVRHHVAAVNGKS